MHIVLKIGIPLLLLFSHYLQAAETKEEPYFRYSPYELKEIKLLESEYVITADVLAKWDQMLTDFINQERKSPGRMVRVFTYLYAAQRDFAFLSYQTHKAFKGSIDSLCIGIIHLFYPYFPAPDPIITDEYSLILSRIVLEKYRERLAEERENEPITSRYLSVRNWGLSDPEYGRDILNWIPWIVPSLVIPITPAPPDLGHEVWQEEIDYIKKMYSNVTEEQKKIALFWGDFFEPGGGNWIKIANDYLFTHEVPLAKIIYVRSVFTMTLYDALIVAFEAKYTYMIPPPYVKDSSILPLVDYFYYPSYPSVHTTVAWAAAHVLTHFFPEERKYWRQHAIDSSDSRIWSGVNYPLDINAGKEVAKEVYRYIKEGT